jgi:vacuolar protein sorting-associated protein 18
MAVSEHMFLIITRANNVYRWRPQIEDECQPMELPELHQAGVGSRLL